MIRSHLKKRPPSLSKLANRVQRKKFAGISLVETLVVVALGLILIALFVGGMKKAVERGNQAKCMSQLRQIGNAFFAYAGDHNGAFPQAFLGSGNRAEDFWSYFLAPDLGLKEGEKIGITAMKCPTKGGPPYSASAYAINYVSIIGVNPGQTGSAWLETGSKRLVGDVDSRAFLVADGVGSFAYSPTIWGLTRDEDGDGVNDSSSSFPYAYNGLDFRHNHRANFFRLNGSIVSLTSAQWATNTENIWGLPR